MSQHVATMLRLRIRIATRLVVLGCGIVVLAIGATTLVGYGIGIEELVRWKRSAVGMAPNTALAFVLTGVSITVMGAADWLWRCDAA